MIIEPPSHDHNGQPTDQRRLEFEHLVLRGIYVLAFIMVVPAKGRRLMRLWRDDAIGYLDKHGRQGEYPRRYRREETMPDLPDP